MTQTHNTHNVEQASSDLVERIYWGKACLAYIIRASWLPDETTFLTPPDYKQQVGYVVYPAGGEIQRHVHRPGDRPIVGAAEVLVSSRCPTSLTVAATIVNRPQTASCIPVT